MSDIWLKFRPRTKSYTLKLPKELYRKQSLNVRGSMKEKIMFRFESDFARLMAVCVLTFGAVSIVAMWCVFC